MICIRFLRTVAFDAMGRFFDPNGNMTDWWDEYSFAQYEDRSNCLINQYSEFSFDGHGRRRFRVDGKLSLNENLADIRGLMAAFNAWKRQMKAHPDKHLVGLERFPKEQLFFLSYGNYWCSKVKAEAMETFVQSNAHAPDFARIIVGYLDGPLVMQRCQLMTSTSGVYCQFPRF